MKNFYFSDILITISGFVRSTRCLEFFILSFIFGAAAVHTTASIPDGNSIGILLMSFSIYQIDSNTSKSIQHRSKLLRSYLVFANTLHTFSVVTVFVQAIVSNSGVCCNPMFLLGLFFSQVVQA